MSITTQVTINVCETIQFKKRKFYYRYQFVSYRNELRLRGFSVGFYQQYKIWRSVIFMYPGMERNDLYVHQFGKPTLKKGNFPKYIRNLTHRKDIVLSDEVKAAAQKKTNLTVVDTLAKQ